MDTIKNLIYAGVGLAATTTDKVKETISDLVEKGKISDTEGKKIIDSIFESTESTREEIENRIKTVSDKVTSTLSFTKKENKEVVELRNKVKELEAKLASKATAPKKATRKTSVASKTIATAKKTVAKATAIKSKPVTKTTVK